MSRQNNVYLLEQFTDDPRFEGFGADGFPESFPRNRTTRTWKKLRLAPNWRPIEVVGRVRKFNDYPCLNLTEPAFSERAVNELRELLEPNGELLPLISNLGNYFAYNVTTVADTLDWRQSDIKWLKEPITAFTIKRYKFLPDKVKDLAIFTLPESPTDVYVTDTFVERAMKRGLDGMHFKKVWPLPPDVDWRMLANAEAAQHRAVRPGQTVKGNSVVMRLGLADPTLKASQQEKKAVDLLMDQIDGLLVDSNSKALVGSLEGADYGVPGECRLFFSCPDADALVERMRPWLKKLKWPRKFLVLKRYGNFRDPKAIETLVEI